MQGNNNHRVPLFGQMAIIMCAVGAMVLAIAGLVERLEQQKTIRTSVGAYRAPVVTSSVTLPTYTPSLSAGHSHHTHASYSAPVVAYNQSERRSLLGSSTGSYRVHERQFTSTGYAGGNIGGGFSGGSSSTGSTSQSNVGGVHTSSISFAMPTIAMNSRISQNIAQEESMVMSAPRRVLIWDPETETFIDDETPPTSNIPGLDPGTAVGQTASLGGVDYTWNGSAWVVSSNEVNNPIGSLPFLLMLLLCGAYVVVKPLSRLDKRDTLSPKRTTC